MNYQIMTEKNLAVNGRYRPDWDAFIANAESGEEKEYLVEHVKRYNSKYIDFTFNCIYITKLACGHYEIFQIPYTEYYTLERIFELAKDHKVRRCTRCICNWNK